ncbi:MULTISPECIES: cupin domain-containing protein [Pirellulaceae]|nr:MULTISPECIES: cupin domain-containing protein [Pirellulaceae]
MKLSPSACEVITVGDFDQRCASSQLDVLLKSSRLRVIRVALAAGASLKEHTAPGELLVQCMQGKVAMTLPHRKQVLVPGQLIHVPDRLPHAVEAIEDSQLLLTIVVDS